MPRSPSASRAVWQNGQVTTRCPASASTAPPHFGQESPWMRTRPRRSGGDSTLRGRAASLAVEGSAQSTTFVEAAAFLGAVPAERAAAEIRRCLPDRPGQQVELWATLNWCPMALPWWSSRRDTTALLHFLRAAERTPWAVRSPQDSTAPNWPVIAARAHIALARRDTSAALEAYRPLTSSTTPWPYQGDRLIAARLLAGRGKVREAAEILNEAPTQEGEIGPRLSDVLWYLERGRIAEQLGDTSRAIGAHRYVAAVWRHADAELQPFVAEARAAMERLSAEQ